MRNRETSRKYYQQNKAKILESSKQRYSKVKHTSEYKQHRAAYQYKRFYNEPIENKKVRLEAQNWKCDNILCQEPIDMVTGYQDHNHETKLVRGILCQRCNHALGLLRENSDIILGLADYIKKFQE